MSSITYTPQQDQAIRDRGHNLLVSAAAGSGKTQVLIERIVRMVVEDRVPLDRMVVVTFTNAAAGEMKTRLAQGLEKALEERPEDGPYLARQIRSLPSANVSTLHAYCIKMMRSYYHVIDLAADFKVASEASQLVLQDQAMQATMEAFYQAQEEGDPFYRLVEAYGGKSTDQGVRLMVQKMASFLRTLAHGDTWLDQAMEAYRQGIGQAFDQDPFYGLWQKAMNHALVEAQVILDQCDDLLPHEGVLAPYRKTLQGDRDLVQALQAQAQEGPGQVSLSFSRLPSVAARNKTEAEVILTDRYKALRDRFKASLKAVADLIPKEGMAGIHRGRDLAAPYLETLIALCRDYRTRYQALKADRHEVDYNDLEHAMLAILEVPEAREAIRQGIDAIFFDEYQDANDVQETIVNALAPEAGLFYVGDVKQAIYSFRFADPEIFNARYKTYLQGEEGRVVHLADNFRSVAPILAFANALFAGLMTPDLGQVDYLAPGQALQPHRPAEGEDPPVHLVVLERDREDMTVPEGEALWIAREAKRLVAEGKASYADMAVLMRSPGRDLATYEKVFKDEHIPFFSDNTSVDFSNMEVRIFHTMLQVLHNSQEDIPLAAVLLSPFGGCTEADLAQIRLYAPEAFFHDACRLYAQDHRDDIAHKLQTFAGFLSFWRAQLRRRPVADVAEALLEESGYSAFLIGLDKGADRLNNVMAFIGRIRDFDADSRAGLAGFLTYADLLKKRQGDRLTPSVGLGAQDDRLQLMSIHKSKGLGFKVVFLADMARTFNMGDKRARLILRKKEGLALQVVDLEAGTTYSPFERKLLQTAIEGDTLSEEVRLLYVAITRAKDRLYLLASVADLDESLAKARERVEPAPGHGGRSFADWIFGPMALAPDQSLLSRDQTPGQALYALTCLPTSQLQGQEERTQAGPAIYRSFPIDDQVQAEISRILSFTYPYLEDTQKPIKTTVTALTEARFKAMGFGEKEEEALLDLPQPRFLHTQPLGAGKEVGTLLHQVLQWIPLDTKKEDLGVLLDAYVVEGRLRPEEREALGQAQPLVNLLQSDLGRKLARLAPHVHREVPFTMRYQGMVVDGQIDLVYQDREGLHLVDFKSDLKPRPSRYLGQIRLYAQALEKAWGQPVRSASLFWLRQGRAHVLGPKDWGSTEVPIEDLGTLD